MSLLDFGPYEGLTTIISGGQDGVDIAGLVAARQAGLKTGGYVPRFCKTNSGSNWDLRDIYGLTETQSTGYIERTKKNVIESDGTLLLGSDLNSPGSYMTKQFANNYNKPLFEIQFPMALQKYYIQKVNDWLYINKITILNIAGNRDKNTRYGYHYGSTYDFLMPLFEQMRL